MPNHTANPNCHMSSIEHATHHKEKVMLPDQCKGCECPPHYQEGCRTNSDDVNVFLRCTCSHEGGGQGGGSLVRAKTAEAVEKKLTCNADEHENRGAGLVVHRYRTGSIGLETPWSPCLIAPWQQTTDKTEEQHPKDDIDARFDKQFYKDGDYVEEPREKLIAFIKEEISRALLADRAERVEKITALKKKHGVVYDEFSSDANLSVYNEAIDDALSIIKETLT